jgi:subtilisin family serine protease
LLDVAKATIFQEFNRSGIGFLRTDGSISEIEIISRIKKLPFVEYAGPNQIVRADYEPNDPYFKGTAPASYAAQWALKNTAQSPPGGTSDADIDAPEAWDLTTGSSNVVVAILDTGIPMVGGALSHEDLNDASRILLGPDVIGDGGGVRDLAGHGTHTAGIIGATGNNGLGITGIAPNSKLLIVQVFDNYGNGTVNSFSAGVDSVIEYQTNNPNKRVIINFSGGANYDPIIDLPPKK